MGENEYQKVLRGKVTERQLDEFASELTQLLPEILRRKTRVRLNIAEVEWIANQELLFITGLLRYFVEAKIPFFVQFLHEDQMPDKISFRKAVQIVQIWDVWRIWQVLPGVNYLEYFDIDGKYTDFLKKLYPISTVKQEIYNRHGITPFVELEKIDHPDDQKISEKLSKVYQLGGATKELLAAHNCTMPFDNQTLSAIVTKELYENFLDHFSKNIFSTQKDYSFLSVSLVTKLDEKDRGEKEIQSILAKNFSEEQFPEAKNFFFDASTKKYRNRSYLQLSFLDFGTGIPDTLMAQYQEKVLRSDVAPVHMLESKVLKHAFRHDSSKDPIDVKYLGKSTVPRGLFDLLVIVKRFGGMLIARSGKGRLLFDFSVEDSVSNRGRYFGNPSLDFPGTLITIYLPERKRSEPISSAAISPFDSIEKLKFDRKKIKYVSLFDIQTEVRKDAPAKNEFYNEVFRKVLALLDGTEPDTLFYIDFAGYQIDSRVTKKLIYFLTTDYRINLSNSVIVVNPPPMDLLEAIHYEMAQLSDTVKRFNIHPVPFISVNDEDVNIFWMGIYDKDDIEKLNRLLLDMSDLRMSDFEDPEAIAGNVNYYDEFGNLRSLIDKGRIIENIRNSRRALQDRQVKELIMPCVKREEGAIYLCNGNYYQYEYLQLFNVLSDKNSCRILSNILAERLYAEVGPLSQFYFLYNSASSKRIVDDLVSLGYVDSEKVIDVGNDLSDVVEGIQKAKVPKGAEFIIACDILSTGYVPYKLGGYLNKLSMTVSKIVVFVNSLDPNFTLPNNRFLQFHGDKIVSLLDYPMKKYFRSQVVDELVSRNLILRRINPFVNTPITQQASENVGEEITLISNRDFISMIEEKHVKAGYFKFNNLIHPYFFDMDELLKDRARSNYILEKLFSKINPEHLKGVSFIFYPRNSGVENVDFDFIKEKILFNHSVEVIELQRFSTNEGWRFTPLPAQMYERVKDKKALILDDGSCSGESIFQMTSEVSSLKVSSILILSVIGRVNDQKRDFFSRLLDVNGKPGTIPVNVYFGSHWHVPTYYTQESPVIAEQQWLDEISQITNLPPNIRHTVSRVRNELRLKEIKETNNQYLVTRKDDSPIVRELLIAKEIIGKVTSYRFYQEHFEHFDELVLDFDLGQNLPSAYRRLEILMAAILHEPNLYEKLKEVMPDLVEKIEDFVKSIFLGIPMNEKGKVVTKEGLYYKWSNKNLLHLLFIAYKEGAFIRTFKQHHIVSILARFCQDESDLSYFLYRILKYFPHRVLKKNSHLYAGHMKLLINGVLENHQLNGKFVKPLKRFRSFLGTLPNVTESFQDSLSTLKSNYSKLVDDENHDSSINVKYDIIATQLELLESKYDPKKVAVVVQEWEVMSSFFENLLSFSNSFPKFFGPCNSKVFGKLETYTDSLRVVHGRIADQIYTINSKTDFREINQSLKKIRESYVLSTSVYFQIFSNVFTPNIKIEYNEFIKELRNTYAGVNLISTGDSLDGISVGVPKYYIQKILFEEIKNNLRHGNLSESISFQWKRYNDRIQLKIINSPVQNQSRTGGGSGMSKLKALSEMPEEPIVYDYDDKAPNNKYVQTLTFKIV
ncbi:hypothetical protein ACQKLP_10785 [Chitinophaga sp. NPDC101104]|uniref:hypothetical protein n=1 Tax=Chitinophaga sp. NPDC101104 TaxID=3390561 RepID=UPI003CFBD1DB